MPTIRLPPDKIPGESHALRYERGYSMMEGVTTREPKELDQHKRLLDSADLPRNINNSMNSIKSTLKPGESQKTNDNMDNTNKQTYSRDIAEATDVPFNDIEEVSRLIEYDKSITNHSHN